MSVSFSNFAPPQHGHFVPAERIVSDSGVNHASAPDLRNNSTTFLLVALSLRGLPHVSHRKTAMGTPHTRCREMHQSGRVWIMFDRRSSPHGGSLLTFFLFSGVRA